MSLILPGNSSVLWTNFKETMDRKAVIIQENNSRKHVGVTTEQIIEFGKMLKRIQILKSDLIGNIEAISFVFKDTFKPYRHQIITKESTKIVEYFDSYIRLVRTNSEKRIETETSLFENHSVEMVIRLLPLELGYSTNLLTFHAGKEKIINVAVRVVSKELVKKVKGTMVEAWKLEVDFAGNIQNYWISIKEKELLKQENFISPEAKMIFERE